MASIQVRHSKGCGLAGRLTSERDATAARRSGKCDPDRCSPTYYVFTRAEGKTVAENCGKDKQDALTRLAEIELQGRRGTFTAPSAETLVEFASAWLESKRGHVRAYTASGYATSVRYAEECFGQGFRLDKFTLADVKRFDRFLAEKGAAESTRSKHLRCLSTLLSAAVEDGKLARHPIPSRWQGKPRPDVERPRSYFTDEELAKLDAAIKHPTYRVMFRVALASGVREGELIALTWADVRLPARGQEKAKPTTLTVSKSFSHGRLEKPKNRKGRVVQVPGVAAMLREWKLACGRPPGDALVFEKDSGGFVDGSYLTRRVLNPAMLTAGVPKVGPEGEADIGSRDWHSLRHTYAVRALSQGIPLYGVSQALGHSSQGVTEKHYGKWISAAQHEAWAMAVTPALAETGGDA